MNFSQNATTSSSCDNPTKKRKRIEEHRENEEIDRLSLCAEIVQKIKVMCNNAMKKQFDGSISNVEEVEVSLDPDGMLKSASLTCPYCQKVVTLGVDRSRGHSRPIATNFTSRHIKDFHLKKDENKEPNKISNYLVQQKSNVNDEQSFDDIIEYDGPQNENFPKNSM